MWESNSVHYATRHFSMSRFQALYIPRVVAYTSRRVHVDHMCVTGVEKV